jgi:hypothetical protein
LIGPKTIKTSGGTFRTCRAISIAMITVLPPCRGHLARLADLTA